MKMYRMSEGEFRDTLASTLREGRPVGYKVVIRRNSDGQKRVHVSHTDYFHPCGSAFWWEEGNGGCDCNRKLFFEQVADPEWEGETSCNVGPNEYDIVEFRDMNNNVLIPHDSES